MQPSVFHEADELFVDGVRLLRMCGDHVPLLLWIGRQVEKLGPIIPRAVHQRPFLGCGRRDVRVGQPAKPVIYRMHGVARIRKRHGRHCEFPTR